MRQPGRLYYTSDVAFNRLITMAQIAQFVKFGSNRVKGLSEYLNKLADVPLKDTRPPLIRERHEMEIRNHRAPTWTHVRQRRARRLTLTEHAVAMYFHKAYKFEIVKNPPYAVGGPSTETPYPAVSYILEALGLEWLTPEWQIKK